MLEQKLIVGRYITLPNVNPAPGNFNPGDFVLVMPQTYYIEESTGVGTKSSQLRTGAGPKAHRNFNWLPWIPGAISETPLVGTDVLTGPMSGCWLVVRRRPNGVPHACHLGTDVGAVANNAAVNNAWNNFAIAHPGDVIGGFNPLRHWAGGFPAAGPKDSGPPVFFGLYTTANTYYILICYRKAGNLTSFRIAGLQMVASSPIGRLQTVDLPGP